MDERRAADAVKRRRVQTDKADALLKRRGPKPARVTFARKLAALLGRIWKDGTQFGVAAAQAEERDYRERKERIRRDRRYQPCQ